jgi:hypothetical protein
VAYVEWFHVERVAHVSRLDDPGPWDFCSAEHLMSWLRDADA